MSMDVEKVGIHMFSIVGERVCGVLPILFRRRMSGVLYRNYITPHSSILRESKLFPIYDLEVKGRVELDRNFAIYSVIKKLYIHS